MCRHKRLFCLPVRRGNAVFYLDTSGHWVELTGLPAIKASAIQAVTLMAREGLWSSSTTSLVGREGAVCMLRLPTVV